MLQTKKNINYFLKHNYLVQNVKRTKVRKTFNPKLCTVVYLIIWNAHFLDHKLPEDTERKVFHFFTVFELHKDSVSIWLGPAAQA